MEKQAEFGKTKVCNNLDCKHGGKAQPIENFAKHPEMKDGRENQCRSCRIRQAKERRLRKLNAVPGNEVKPARPKRVKPDQGKSKPAKEALSVQSAVDGVLVSIDFSGHMDLYEHLAEISRENLRPVDMQALFVIKVALGK